MPEPKYLLDVNVLIALTEPEHTHHHKATDWFSTPGLDWGLCAFSQAGFLRIATNPKIGAHSLQESTSVLAALTNRPGYRFWPITTGLADLAAPIRKQIFGHNHITDAYLLGLAIQENGILITLDEAIPYLAGLQFSQHVLVLKS